MKSSTVIIAGGLLVLLLFISTPKAVDLSSLSDSYGSDNTQRLQNVGNVIAGYGISGDTLRYMLAQILQETGLFTSNPNYHATDDLNNYAGISSNGSLKGYNSINDFVTDYIRVLSLPNNYPIQATSITDFNNRLYANGYYTDSPTTYGNNLTYYFNLLS